MAADHGDATSLMPIRAPSGAEMIPFGQAKLSCHRNHGAVLIADGQVGRAGFRTGRRGIAQTFQPFLVRLLHRPPERKIYYVHARTRKTEALNSSTSAAFADLDSRVLA